VLAGLGKSIRLTAGQPRLRLMMALLTAEAVVVGALDLLFVILAISVLHRPQAWAGYLNSAYGVGAVLAALVSATLVGRRLGLPILGAALLLSGALAALAAGLGLPGPWPCWPWRAPAVPCWMSPAAPCCSARSRRSCGAGSSGCWKG